MSVKKNQHYVPQMQLRYFSVDENKKLINIYHRETSRRIENVSISNQASEDYFYGIDGVLEEKLGEIESKLSVILKNIIVEKTLPRKDSLEHFLLLLYVVFSKVRTRKQLDKLNESQNLIFQNILSSTNQFKDIANDYEIRMNDPFSLLFGVALKSFYLIYDLEYKILVNETDTPFILSDHPIVTYNDFNNQRGLEITNGRGLSCKGLQIIFPLSPEICLFFYDSWCYKLGNKKAQKLNVTDKKDIFQLNLLQLLNSNEIFFFNSKVTSGYIEKLILASKKYDSFDEQGLEEFISTNSDIEKSSILMMKNLIPKLELKLNQYKLQDRAKNWKPDSRIVYLRSDWHINESRRISKTKD